MRKAPGSTWYMTNFLEFIWLYSASTLENLAFMCQIASAVFYWWLRCKRYGVQFQDEELFFRNNNTSKIQFSLAQWKGYVSSPVPSALHGLSYHLTLLIQLVTRPLALTDPMQMLCLNLLKFYLESGQWHQIEFVDRPALRSVNSDHDFWLTNTLNLDLIPKSFQQSWILDVWGVSVPSDVSRIGIRSKKIRHFRRVLQSDQKIYHIFFDGSTIWIQIFSGSSVSLLKWQPCICVSSPCQKTGMNLLR